MNDSQNSFQFCPKLEELEHLFDKEQKSLIALFNKDVNRSTLKKAIIQAEDLTRYLDSIQKVAQDLNLIAYINQTREELNTWYHTFKAWDHRFSSMENDLYAI